MPSTSRRRRQKLSAAVEVNEAEDRISNLPRNLISHILSFLPTKYAVRTGILSTKWKWMWTSISNLDFDDEMLFYTANSSSNDERRQMSFLKFVYRVMLLLKGSNVNTFRIKCSPISNVSYVNSWVTAVLLRNVREVDICLPLGSSCLPLGSSVLLPTDLFCCDKLEVLKLDLEFVLNIPSLVDLKSLKTLHLSSVEFMDDESIKRLFSSCPVLEVLAFIECGGKNVSIVNISAPALKRLIVNHPASCWDTSIHENGIINTEAACPYEYQLNTPNLLYFAYMGWVAEGFDMNNLSSLVEASVDIDSCYEGQFYTSMAELLHGISHVQTLHLSGESFKTLETYASNRGSRLPVFHSLTTLELGEIHIGANWRLLPNLLECSPNLRTLGFKGLVDDYFDLNNFREWYTPERVPTCLSVTLEKINMGMFRGQENEVKVVEYFLTNAKVLKIMSIRFNQYYQMPREQSKEKIFRKLLEMPRGSTSCKVMVT